MKHTLILLLIVGQAFGQTDSTRRIRAIPLPDYGLSTQPIRGRLVTDVRLDTVIQKLDSIIYLLNLPKK